MIQTLAGYINIILSYFYNLVGDYGLAIIMLTAVVNIITFPLTRKQIQASKKLQDIQPELRKLQEKYKHDKEKYNKVTMEYMKEHKVNPMGGCLPLLVQFPIMIAVFQLLREPGIIAQSVENFNPNFLFFPLDLTKPDPIYLLPIMAAAATFFHQRLVMTDPKQKMMLYIFPVMIMVISVSFPAGLVLYWFTNSLFSVGNHYLLKRTESAKNIKELKLKENNKTEKEYDKKEEENIKDNGYRSKDNGYGSAEVSKKENTTLKQARKKKGKGLPQKDAPKTRKKTTKGKKKGAEKAR
ncbi:MAG: membrane protein insertase YidC [Dethiobacter sp.]|jgi:YidC/Oxa1 family membrane protein insertase|nr:MAG: membrane protein insertase YidC [Dethiobacter sp.]